MDSVILICVGVYYQYQNDLFVKKPDRQDKWNVCALNGNCQNVNRN